MDVRFFEKPGCVTNTRQKAMLVAAGHAVEARNLLTEPWTASRLMDFFGDLPTSQWFNRAAPAVKSGVVDPGDVDRDTAMALLLAEPLLIRRPLIEAGDWRCTGFDLAAVDRAIGLPRPAPEGFASEAPLEGCAHGNSERVCPPPA
jgi:nitrogenase-associated protein